MARTALFSRKQSGGVFTIANMAEHPGNVWFVDSALGSDAAGFGYNPDSPFATLAYAFSSDVLASGDVVYVMPGHAEAVAAARGIIMDIAGVRVIGLGWGGNRPTFTGTTGATVTIEIAAANIWLENLLFVAGFTNGITEFIDVKTLSNDLVFKGCEWRETLNTQEFLKCVTIEATISRVTFDGCRFKGVIGGDSLAAIFAEGAITDLRVINSSFNGDWLDAVIDTDAGAITTPEFGNLMIRNADPTNGFAITINTATIGSFWDCAILTQKANTVPVAVLASSFFSNVIGTDVAATQGIPLPATATAWA